MSKTKTERITGIEEQIKQLEAQKKQLIQKQKAEERKARTRRLIERGAILESIIDEAEALTNEQVKIFLEKTIKTEFAAKILYGLKAQGGETVTPEPTAAEQASKHAAATIEGNDTGKAG